MSSIIGVILLYATLQGFFLGSSVGIGFLLSWLFPALSLEFASILGGMGNGAVLLLLKTMLDTERKSGLSHLLDNLVPLDEIEDEDEPVIITPQHQPRSNSPGKRKRRR